MRRATLALVLGCLATAPAGAQTSPVTVLPGRMPSLSQGRTTDPFANFVPAPVPNVDLVPPVDRTASDVQLRPRLMPTVSNHGIGGNGYAPGSSYSSSVDRRGRSGNVTPSLQLKMPVQIARP